MDMNKKNNAKELLLKILRSELEREKCVKKLAAELDELENRAPRDKKRIDEIVNELKTINPFPDDDIREGGKMLTKRIKKRRRFIPVKIAAACIAAIISVQIISFSAYGVNIFGWTKDRFMDFIGTEGRQENISYLSSGAEIYETIEELERNENIKIVVPNWLPGDIKIDYIIYSYDYTENQVDIIYDDDITTLSIKLNFTLPNVNGVEIHEKNNNIFYIIPDENIMLWEFNGNFYNFTCRFYINEYIEKIIENIK